MPQTQNSGQARVVSDTPTPRYRLREQMRNKMLHIDEILCQGVDEVLPVVSLQLVMASSLKTAMFVLSLGPSNARAQAQAGLDRTADRNLRWRDAAARAAAPSDGASARVTLRAVS